MPNRRRSRKKRFPPRILKWFGLTVVGLAVAGTWWFITLPDGSAFISKNPQKTSIMLHREEQHIRGHLTWIPLAQIVPELRHSVIVAEDANFYRHHGVNWEALWEALQRDWKERRLYRGGSTITQQLAKNIYLDPSKTISRKITEALIAMRMERTLNKRRILELYLNVVEWGRGIYGAEAAAPHYFGKSAAVLTIEEASWLAAILPAPLRYEINPRARAVQTRAATIQRYVELRLAGQIPPLTLPVLPPLPSEETEELPEPHAEPQPPADALQPEADTSGSPPPADFPSEESAAPPPPQPGSLY